MVARMSPAAETVFTWARPSCVNLVVLLPLEWYLLPLCGAPWNNQTDQANSNAKSEEVEGTAKKELAHPKRGIMSSPAANWCLSSFALRRIMLSCVCLRQRLLDTEFLLTSVSTSVLGAIPGLLR